MSETIFLHIENPGYLPTGSTFESVQNIDNYSNDSIQTMMIHDLLDYYDDQYIKPLLDHIKTKIKPGGYISIQSVDIKQLAIALAFNEINTSLTKNILYPNKKSIHTLKEIQQLLIDLGFVVENKKYINIFEYYILAQKI